jgi:hypothetical protein
VSQFFGCTPLGPLGWAGGLSAAVAGTGVAALLTARPDTGNPIPPEEEP